RAAAAARAARGDPGGALREESAQAGRVALGAAGAAGGEARRRAAAAGARAAGRHVRGGHHRARARPRAVGRPSGRAGALLARDQGDRRGVAAQADAALLAAAARAAAGTEVIACLSVPDLPLVAALRAEPQLAGTPF